MTRNKLLYISSRQYRLVVAVVVSLLRGGKSSGSSWSDAEIECRKAVEGIFIPDSLCQVVYMNYQVFSPHGR